MKKIISLLLAAMLLLSMTACGIVGAPQETTPEVYVPSADIEVVHAYVVEGALTGNIKVATRRLSEKALKSMELTCVYYSASGEQVGESETIECTFSQQNKFSVWTFSATSLPAYVEAIVSSVTYEDETKSVCPGVSTWVKTSSATFTAEKYAKQLEDMAKTEAAAAEKSDVTCEVGQIEEQKVGIALTNTGDKEIAEIMLYVLWFDATGAPVDMKGVFVPNTENVTAKSLAVGEKATYKVSAPEGAASAKAIVKEITYADETVWENDFTYEWAFSNYNGAK